MTKTMKVMKRNKARMKKFLFWQEKTVVEMQLKGGAAATMQGFLQAGAVTISYAASQELF